MVVIATVLAGAVEVLADEGASSLADASSSDIVDSVISEVEAFYPEGYYTPWGQSAINEGIGYYKTVLGAAITIGAFCFALPYVVDLVVMLFNTFADHFKR